MIQVLYPLIITLHLGFWGGADALGAATQVPSPVLRGRLSRRESAACERRDSLASGVQIAFAKAGSRRRIANQMWHRGRLAASTRSASWPILVLLVVFVALVFLVVIIIVFLLGT